MAKQSETERWIMAASLPGLERAKELLHECGIICERLNEEIRTSLIVLGAPPPPSVKERTGKRAKKASGKRKMSPETRRLLSASQRARWAKARKEGRNTLAAIA